MSMTVWYILYGLIGILVVSELWFLYKLPSIGRQIEKKKQERKEQLAENIINGFVKDIRDRKGLDNEWDQIDKDIKENEIFPAWKELIINEVESYLNR